MASSELIYTLTHSSLRSWGMTIYWLGFNVLGALMPLWGMYVSFRLHGRMPHLGDFVDRGEFALYTAAFLAPAVQLVVANIKQGVLGLGAVLFALAGWGFSIIIYSGVVLQGGIDEIFLRRSSLWLFAASLLFAAVVTLVTSQQQNPDVEGFDSKEKADLDERVNAKNPPSIPVSDLRQDTAVKIESDEDLAKKFRADGDSPQSDGGENA